MKFELDEDDETLSVDGEAFEITDDGSFEVAASQVRTALLSDLPIGCSIALCDRVIGSHELYRRHPSCIFEHTTDDHLVAHGDVAFFVNEGDDVDAEGCKEFLASCIKKGRENLTPLSADGVLLKIEESIYEEIAYLKFSLRLLDQTIPEAEAFIDAVEERIREGVDRPLLFICHASDDKPFDERLVAALDQRALYAWFDKREILVGDSIVHRINEALAETRYVVPVLSSRSVEKPWVQRELNSSLMRQLGDHKISILPVLIDDCRLPPLIADIKYADFRTSFDRGFSDLLRAIQR